MFIDARKAGPGAMLSVALVAGVFVTSARPDGTPVAARQPAAAPAWKEQFTLKHESAVTAVAASAELVAVADAGCELRLWGVGDGNEVDLPVRGPRSLVPADALRFTPDDRYLLLFSPGGLLTRYERRAGGMVGSGVAFDGYVPLALSADLNTLVTRKTGRQGAVGVHGNVWAEPRNALRPAELIELPENVAHTHVALSADDRRLAVACDDGAVRVYDRRLKEIHQIKLKKGQKPAALRLSDDGKLLAVAGECGFARLFDTDTGMERCELKGHAATVTAVAFSPNGKRIATAGGKEVRVFDAASGKPVGTVAGHTGTVTAVAFSTDGKRLVTGSADKTARVWEPKE